MSKKKEKFDLTPDEAETVIHQQRMESNLNYQDVRTALLLGKLKSPPNTKQRFIRNETKIGKTDKELEEICMKYKDEIVFPINEKITTFADLNDYFANALKKYEVPKLPEFKDQGKRMKHNDDNTRYKKAWRTTGNWRREENED